MSLPPQPLRYGPPLSLERARQVMAAAEAEAHAQGWPLVIAIVDSSGHLKLLHRLDNAQYASVQIAQLKAETALNFRRDTVHFEAPLSEGKLRFLGVPGMTPLEGGVLLLEHGEIVGAIGVSGMASGQDAQVAHVGARALE